MKRVNSHRPVERIDKRRTEKCLILARIIFCSKKEGAGEGRRDKKNIRWFRSSGVEWYAAEEPYEPYPRVCQGILRRQCSINDSYTVVPLHCAACEEERTPPVTGF